MSDPRKWIGPSEEERPARPAWLDGGAESVRPAPFAIPRDHAPATPKRKAARTTSTAIEVPASVESSLPGTASERPQRVSKPPPGSSIVPPPSDPFASEAAQAFAAAALELATARAQVLATTERSLLDLATEIARAILEQEVESHPELHVQLARAALRTLGSPEGALLRASPMTSAAIRAAFGESFVEWQGVMVRVVEDPSLEGLGCIAENEHAEVDGRVAERLRAVRRGFEEEHRKQWAEGDGR